MAGLALTDRDGFELGAASDGVLVDDGCAPGAVSNCCGGATDCSRLRRYDRCPISASDAGCTYDGPPWVWVCEDFRCTIVQLSGGGSALFNGPPAVIQWRGIGYVRTETVVDAGDVPPGDTVWNAIDAGVDGTAVCFDSCGHPFLNVRTCPIWEEAIVCAGQVLPVGAALPRVFVPVRDSFRPDPPYLTAGQCGTTTAQVGGRAGDALLCFEWRVGSRPWRGALPAGAVVGVFTSIGAQCCNCLSNCGSVIGDVPDCFIPGRVRRLGCCCPCGGRFSSQYQWRHETIYSSLAGGAVPPGPEVYAASGQGSIEVDDDCQEKGRSGTATETYDFFNNNSGAWVPIHESGPGTVPTEMVCLDTGVGGLVSGRPVFGHPWPVVQSNGSVLMVDANFKCPSELGGRRRFTWVSEDGTESEEMVIEHAGKIVRCGFIATSWWGTSVYRTPSGTIHRRFTGSRSAQRDGENRCGGTMGCGGSSGSGGGSGVGGLGALMTGGCAACGDDGSGGALI